MRSISSSVIHGFRQSWKDLLLTDILYKILAFVILTPLIGILFRTLLAFSGNAFVSDLDIVFFFIGPVGLLCFILVGALSVGLVALQQTSLVAIICAKTMGRQLPPVAALRFAASNAWSVIELSGRLVAVAFLTIAPFAAVGAGIYLSLLTEYDINYYLRERPPAFGIAISIGSVLIVTLVALLLRLFTGYLYALPMLLFEQLSPREALRRSVAKARGHRIKLLGWIVGWSLVQVVLSALATGIVAFTGHFLIPGSTNSLHWLAFTTGMTLLLWGILNFALNLVGTSTFAAILFALYERLALEGAHDKLPIDIEATTEQPTTLRISTGRLIAVIFLGIVLAVLSGSIAIQSVDVEDEVRIIAHRGSSKAAPENTMAAFIQAIDDGADWIELDVQETADGEVVVFHDSDFMKLAGRNLKIWDAKTDDLQGIDVGSWFSAEFQHERVPTLANVLNECRGKIGVVIELKYYGHDKNLEQRVADIVESCEMESEIMVMSLKMDGVRKMNAIRPTWNVGLLMSVSAGNLKRLEADFIAVNAAFANGGLIRRAHDNDKAVYVWTVNDAATMSTMISRGADGLITDKPALARFVLQQRAEMSVPERLLLELASLLGSAPDIAEQ